MKVRSLGIVAWIAVSLAGASLMAASVGEQARGKIQHVVIIVQENRTFDNIFGGIAGNTTPNFEGCPAKPVPFPGADSAFSKGIPWSKWQCGRYEDGNVQASHDVWQCLNTFSTPFSDKAWLNLLNKKFTCSNGQHPLDKDTTTMPFMYLANDLRQTYWDIATKYVLGDHFFAVTSTASFPGHQYIVADQSRDAYGDIVTEQPDGNPKNNGCKDNNPDREIDVSYLGSDGYTLHRTVGIGGECYCNATLADLMQKRGVSWTHYTTVNWNGFSFEHSDVFDGFINIRNWAAQTDSWPTSLGDLQANIAKGQLAAVTWVKPPCVALSDHPNHSHDAAASWVGSVVNWIGKQPELWNSTAIFVVWDDWGGFYDHVVPPKTRKSDGLGPGVRIPFLLISPYGVNGSVVKTTADYASILKFTEDLFGLGWLTEVDHNAADLTGFFDFSKQRPFVKVSVAKEFTEDDCKAVGASLAAIDPD